MQVKRNDVAVYEYYNAPIAKNRLPIMRTIRVMRNSNRYMPIFISVAIISNIVGVDQLKCDVYICVQLFAK